MWGIPMYITLEEDIMKRIVTLALALVMLLTFAVTFCSCEKVKCLTCGDEIAKMKAEKGELFGEEYYMCPDCVDQAEDIADALS